MAFMAFVYGTLGAFQGHTGWFFRVAPMGSVGSLAGAIISNVFDHKRARAALSERCSEACFIHTSLGGTMHDSNRPLIFIFSNTQYASEFARLNQGRILSH